MQKKLFLVLPHASQNSAKPNSAQKYDEKAKKDCVPNHDEEEAMPRKDPSHFHLLVRLIS